MAGKRWKFLEIDGTDLNLQEIAEMARNGRKLFNDDDDVAADDDTNNNFDENDDDDDENYDEKIMMMMMMMMNFVMMMMKLITFMMIMMNNQSYGLLTVSSFKDIIYQHLFYVGLSDIQILRNMVLA